MVFKGHQKNVIKKKLEASRLHGVALFHVEAFIIISGTDLKLTNTNWQFAKHLRILNCSSSSKIMK